MIKPNYRIVHLVDVPAPAVLEAQRLGFGWCTSRHCPEAPTSLLCMDLVREGRLLTRTPRFCPAHAARWCAVHQVEVARVSHDPVVGCAPPRPADAILGRCGVAS